jgi:hypothetical protein
MTIDEIFINAVESWKNNKGIGTMLCPAPLNDKVPLLLILQRIYSRSPTCSTIIIVENFNYRLDLIDFLTKQEDEENNNEFKRLLDEKYIRIFTHDFVNSGRWHSPAFLGILYNPESFDLTYRLWLDNCKFKLVVLNHILDNQEDRLYLSKICPILDEFKQSEIDELRTSLPVEEMWVGVDIPSDSENCKLLDYYNKQITKTLNIFGSIDSIKCARTGNSITNESAVQFCTRIANENGWNDKLDMSTEYNRMIDEVYNPNTLNECAKNFYEIVRERSNIVTDFEGKLNSIYDICKKHENEKILIISKRGEFAANVTIYLNNMFDDVVCGDYHNKVENIILRNRDGSPVLVKSGVNKGKPKEIGYQAQMTLNQRKFNDGEINILSTSNSPDKNLNIDVDIIIITSPLCEDIKSYLYRLTKVNYRGGSIKLYTIFCKSTLEHKQLLEKEVSINHVIVNKDENIDISKNNFDFVIAD